jgi:hypothetical protein
MFLAIALPYCGTSRAEEHTVLQSARLVDIQKQVSAYAADERYVINERELLENSKKTDAKSYDRRIYLKLPLYGNRFHWKFQEKSKLISGNLTLTIKRGNEIKTLVIFNDGAISDDWEVLNCCDQGPNEMYFGFATKKTYSVSETDAVELRLLVNSDIKGIGPEITGNLKRGDYVTFTQFKIYHLEQSTKEKDVWAFLNDDAWNIQWKLDITSHHGWYQ